MPRRSKSERTERGGVWNVARIFNDEFGWIFREQSGSDYGVDAYVEVVQDDEVTGELIALQIKCGSSYFPPTVGGFTYRGSKKHLEYWTRHSLPVFLILHDPEKRITLWHCIDGAATALDGDHWSVVIPEQNALSRTAIEAVLAAARARVATPRWKDSAKSPINENDTASPEFAEAGRTRLLDRRLRLHLTEAIEIFEASLRQLMYEEMRRSLAGSLAQTGNFDPFDPIFYDANSYRHATAIRLAKIACKRKARERWLHFARRKPARSKMSDQELNTGIDIAYERMTVQQRLDALHLTSLAHAFSALRKDISVAVSRRIQLPQPILASMIYSLGTLRNRCEHKEQVWNYHAQWSLMRFPQRYTAAAVVTEMNKHTIYACCAALRILLALLQPRHLDWHLRLGPIVDGFEPHLVTAMGFPPRWRDISFWRLSDIRDLAAV